MKEKCLEKFLLDAGFVAFEADGRFLSGEYGQERNRQSQSLGSMSLTNSRGRSSITSLSRDAPLILTASQSSRQ